MTKKILIIVVIFKQFIFCVLKKYDSCKHHHNDFLTVQIIIVKKNEIVHTFFGTKPF